MPPHFRFLKLVQHRRSVGWNTCSGSSDNILHTVSPWATVGLARDRGTVTEVRTACTSRGGGSRAIWAQGLVALDKGAGVKGSWYSLGSNQEQGEEDDGLHVRRYETG